MQQALLPRVPSILVAVRKDLIHIHHRSFRPVHTTLPFGLRARQDSSQTAQSFTTPRAARSTTTKMSSFPVIPTTFLILSDTHNFVPDPSKPKYPLNNLLSQNQKFDVLLHCGDLTQVGGSTSYKKFLNFLSKVNADLKLIIAGNHDLDLDPNHAEDEEEREDHAEAIELMTGPLAMEAGVTYLSEGNHTFSLSNGAVLHIFVSPYTPKVGDWAFGYPREKGEGFWKGKIDMDVDFVMTHGPMKGELDSAHGGAQGCEGLRKEVDRVRPIVHCFGHIHEGYGVKVKEWEAQGEIAAGKEVEDREVRFGNAGVEREEKGEVARLRKGMETLVVNAATMHKGEPVNAPWLLEVPLRRK